MPRETKCAIQEALVVLDCEGTTENANLEHNDGNGGASDVFLAEKLEDGMAEASVGARCLLEVDLLADLKLGSGKQFEVIGTVQLAQGGLELLGTVLLGH